MKKVDEPSFSLVALLLVVLSAVGHKKSTLCQRRKVLSNSPK